MMKMFRVLFKLIGIAVLLLFFQRTFYSCSSDPEKTITKTDTVKLKASVPELHRIEIDHMKFIPSEITVKKGDKIVFVNYDMMVHDVTEERNRSWTSSPLKTGEYWTLVVTESADYFCSLHQVMKGRITVE